VSLLKHLSGPRPLLYLLVWIGDCGMSLFIFTITRHLAEQEGNLVNLGIFGSSLSVTIALCAALCGHVSDRLGRRRMIAVGSALMSVSFGFAHWSLEAPWIYLQAVLLGLAFALIIPPVIALLSASSARTADPSCHTRTLIFFCLAWNLGMVSGQLSGGFLFVLGPHLGIKVCLGLAAVHFALNLVAAARERGGTNAAGNIGDRRDPVAADRDLEPRFSATQKRMFAVFGWIANVGGSASMGLIIFLLPRLMATLEISPPVHGSMIMSSRILVVITYFTLYLSRFWQYRLAPGLCAQAVAMAGLLIITSAESVPLLTLGVMLIGVMMGYNYFSGIFYATTAFSRRSGLATGMHEGTLALGFLIGSLGGGLVGSEFGVRAPFAIGIGIIGLAMAMEVVGLLWMRWRARPSTAEGR
jgi:DHA1 family multidrug resistance protein-like MFS transporter